MIRLVYWLRLISFGIAFHSCSMNIKTFFLCSISATAYLRSLLRSLIFSVLYIYSTRLSEIYCFASKISSLMGFLYSSHSSFNCSSSVFEVATSYWRTRRSYPLSFSTSLKISFFFLTCFWTAFRELASSFFSSSSVVLD